MRVLQMKPYKALFTQQNKFVRTEVVVDTDGINDGHAQARAWIKLMTKPIFKNGKHNWILEKLSRIEL
jgi:hypothetical protein